MFRKKDVDFLAALDDPARLEKLLVKLRMHRRSSTIIAAANGFGLMILLWFDKTHAKSGAFTATLILLVILVTMKAYAAHSQIRTVLVFKKLKDPI